MPTPITSGNSNPMFSSELNPIKGAFGSIYVLDKAVELGSTALNPVTPKAGRVGSQHSGTTPPPAGGTAQAAERGRFQLGVPAFDTGVAPVPIFLLQSADDFDVIGDYGNVIGAPPSKDTATPEGGVYNGRTGVVSGLVGTGGFEVETTEFFTDATVTESKYVPGALLTSHNANDVNLGKVKYAGDNGGGATPTNKITIIGVVSDGIIGATRVNPVFGNPTLNQDQYGAPKRLRFHTCYVPRY